MSAALLEARGLSKRFAHLQALRNVDASFRAGEIHAVVGQNGAGKSTLMNLIGGFSAADEGEITLEGAALAMGDRLAARRAGIAMVHQHFMLVPRFTVEENLALAACAGGFQTLDCASLAGPALERARELGWDLSPSALVETLPVGTQQRIEIAKALATKARVLILDEPTAVLSRLEVDELFGVLRVLRGAGCAVILIAHKLSEVLSIADRVTVLRDGVVVATAPTADVDGDTLAAWMVGALPEFAAAAEGVAGEVAMEVRDLCVAGDRGEPAVRRVSFSVRSGEVFGIGGVDGNGQVELAEALSGVRRAVSGTVQRIGGGPLPEAAYIPSDRQAHGLALRMSVSDNLLIAGHRRNDLAWGPVLLLPRIRDWAKRLMASFAIKAPSPEVACGTLSGGNQQKVVVARCIDGRPGLLIAVNPTRGLDIAAAEYVRRRITDAARDGAAVVVFSADLEELSQISNRTAFLSRGTFAEGAGQAAVLGGTP